MNNETFELNSHDPLFNEVVEYARGQKRLTVSGISEKFASASTEQTALSDKSRSREY